MPNDTLADVLEWTNAHFGLAFAINLIVILVQFALVVGGRRWSDDCGGFRAHLGWCALMSGAQLVSGNGGVRTFIRESFAHTNRVLQLFFSDVAAQSPIAGWASGDRRSNVAQHTSVVEQMTLSAFGACLQYAYF